MDEVLLNEHLSHMLLRMFSTDLAYRLVRHLIIRIRRMLIGVWCFGTELFSLSPASGLCLPPPTGNLMKPFLSYGFIATAMFALTFLTKSLVGIEFAMIVASIITIFLLNKLFPIPQVKN